MAGDEIIRGLLHINIPPLLRRVVMLIPAIVVLAAGLDPTFLLVASQVILSFGIAFAVVPLVMLASRRAVEQPDHAATGSCTTPWMTSAGWCTPRFSMTSARPPRPSSGCAVGDWLGLLVS
ncbi:hypothetical protein GCM10022222_09840 [Amycolatopsis ultiminotia]|uniref:Uncharacterized protein n=1 Tax=Amycolatopsis ultiminotia TaxID=543629 RepID=A0ABP6V503_9PSEU